jgi:serine protease Do
MFVLVKSPFLNMPVTNNEKEESAIKYNSCSNCKTGTITVENGGISESVAKVYDSVVMVKVYKNGTLTGSGSGFVYKKDNQYGYIMTNYHVIDGGTSVKIKLTSEEVVDGEILGGDKYMDIAIIRISKDYVISVAKIGSTEKLKLGETVFAIGTPVGEEYFNTVTGGYISGLNRKMKVTVESNNDWVQDVLQIDVAINPGNSGGALFNFNGEVIGVTSMKLVNQQIEGMGFAIKIEDAMKHLESFENGKEIDRPMLGISYIDVSQKTALQYYGIKIDSSLEEGVVVVKVEPGSVADKAGLKNSDVIVKVNNDSVSSSAYLRYLLYKYNIGDTIKITYNRDGKNSTTTVKLTDKK